MTDMHCHILPCVDDGASSVEEACSMAWKAWENGTERIIATPHFCLAGPKDAGCPFRSFAHCVYLLQKGLQELGRGLELRSGMEVFATAELPKLMEERKLLTLADSRYLLVEFYFDEHETYICDTPRMVAERGFVPVIAHPERYHAVRTPALAREWFSRGYIMQLNKGTIFGPHGPGRQADGLVASGAWPCPCGGQRCPQRGAPESGPVPGAGCHWPGFVLAICGGSAGGKPLADFPE